MDRVIAYWQSMGVDGFRCDMSHMEPPEFWKWLIARARGRAPEVFFMGEAYDGDPAKVPGSDPVISQLHGGKSNVMFDLLDAGFDAVYDDPTYKALKNIYDGRGWANDLDHARADDFIFENSVRYAENHDEVRLAGRGNWGGVGMNARPCGGGHPLRCRARLRSCSTTARKWASRRRARKVSAATTRAPRSSIIGRCRSYSNGRTDTSYDGGRLSDDQKQLRENYRRLLAAHERAGFS